MNELEKMDVEIADEEAAKLHDALAVCSAAIGSLKSKEKQARLLAALAILLGVDGEMAEFLSL